MRGLCSAALGALAVFAVPPDARAAVITFSGLNNGVNTATDPHNTTTGNAIPSNYQPLMNAYPAPGGNTDGGNIGVTITYASSFVAAKASNNTVNDHTQMATATDSAQVNLYDNSQTTISLTFDKAVAVPSFWYAFFASGTYSGTFSAYTNAADTTPAATYTFGPSAKTSYAWAEETRFGDTPLRKLTFTRSAQYLQIDDITVVLAPEPGAAGVLAAGSAALLGLRRRRQA